MVARPHDVQPERRIGGAGRARRGERVGGRLRRRQDREPGRAPGALAGGRSRAGGDPADQPSHGGAGEGPTLLGRREVLPEHLLDARDAGGERLELVAGRTGQLATELVNSAEMIVGDVSHFAAVSIGFALLSFYLIGDVLRVPLPRGPGGW